MPFTNLSGQEPEEVETHLASIDYPELEEILMERPPPERQIRQFAAKQTDQKCPLCGLNPVSRDVGGMNVCESCAQNQLGIPLDNNEPEQFGQARFGGKGLPKTQKCKWCDNQATKRYLWAEGMAYIPTCPDHESKTRDCIEGKNHDEVVGIKDIAYKDHDSEWGNGSWEQPEEHEKTCERCGGSGLEDNSADRCYACGGSGTHYAARKPQQTWRQRVEGLPQTSEWDMAIDDAVQGQHDLGNHDEEDDEFWHTVHDHAHGQMEYKHLHEGGVQRRPFFSIDISSEASIDKVASFWDVQQKAKRLRLEGNVKLLEIPQADFPYVYGQVQGDHGNYYVVIQREGHRISDWMCQCTWGEFGPSGMFSQMRDPSSPYKNRKCSHILAAAYELQARTMFGRTSSLHANNDGGAHSGVMIALCPPKEIAEDLAVNGGEPPEDMHVTLMYFPDKTKIDPFTIDRILKGFRFEPLNAKLSGFGNFEVDPEHNDGHSHCHVGLVSIPGFDKLRTQLAEELKKQHIEPSEQFGPQPHITIAYAHEPMEYDKMPDLPKEFPINNLTFAYGSHWHDYPLKDED